MTVITLRICVHTRDSLRTISRDVIIPDFVGGKARMRRLMNMVSNHRIDLTPLITHRFSLNEILDAYEVFGDRRDG